MYRDMHVWSALVGEEDGPLVQAILAGLYRVPEQVLRDAMRRIQAETAVGPLFDPSAYVDGTRFNNAEKYLEVLDALIRLRRTLPDAPKTQGGDDAS